MHKYLCVFMYVYLCLYMYVCIMHVDCMCMLCACTRMHICACMVLGVCVCLCNEKITKEPGQVYVQLLFCNFLHAAEDEVRFQAQLHWCSVLHVPRAVLCLNTAGWQRQDNIPWGAELLGSPLKYLIQSDTHHLKSPACPRSHTTTGLLLISLRSLCWLLNNKHRRGRCD